MGLENCVESKALLSGSARSRHVVASIAEAAAYVCVHSCVNGEKVAQNAKSHLAMREHRIQAEE